MTINYIYNKYQIYIYNQLLTLLVSVIVFLLVRVMAKTLNPPEVVLAGSRIRCE